MLVRLFITGSWLATYLRCRLKVLLAFNYNLDGRKPLVCKYSLPENVTGIEADSLVEIGTLLHLIFVAEKHFL